MVRSNEVVATIANHCDQALMYSEHWFSSGELAKADGWPGEIKPGARISVRLHNSEASIMGCSGWVKYLYGGENVFFCFSNPTIGQNKIAVGTTAQAWDLMNSHYKPTTVKVELEGSRASLLVDIFNTQGQINHAFWKVTPSA